MLKNLMSAAIIVVAGPVWAQGMAVEMVDPGAVEFSVSCAVCHGADGKGEGSLAPILTVPVPDLTTMASRNDGEFPFLQTLMTIDGRTGTRGHGFPMPVWGDRYKTEVEERVAGYGAELIVRGRILALTEYVQSLQE